MLQGSVIVFIEITTIEPNRVEIEILATALKSNDSQALEQLKQNLTADNVTVTILSVEVGQSDAQDSDFTVSSPVRDVQVQTSSSDCQTSASVTWKIPESDGGAEISTYIIFCASPTSNSPPGAIVGSDSRSTSIGPFNPGSFTCTVKAVNAAGANDGTVSSLFDVV